jgi:hypothetical protein
MNTKDPELDLLEKKLRVLNRSLLSENHMHLDESEANYLMKGYATDLIEKVWLPNTHYNSSYVKIYGVQLKDKTNGRYLWIYLYYRGSLYKCYDLKRAFDLIDKLREVNDLETKEIKVNKKNAAKQKLLQITSN